MDPWVNEPIKRRSFVARNVPGRPDVTHARISSKVARRPPQRHLARPRQAPGASASVSQRDLRRHSAAEATFYGYRASVQKTSDPT